MSHAPRTLSTLDRCEECGFSYDLATAPEAPSAILAGVSEFTRVLRAGDPEVRTRPHPETWSPLEYACHLRDVLLVQRERVLLARRTDRPTVDPMGRDERVDHDGYADQAPDDVVRQLTDAATLFSNVLTRLRAPDWKRTVVYPYPEPCERTLSWVALHTRHEVEHHLLDVRRQLQ